ncbi:MAG: hypothetical protein AMXMBFR78_32470 [Rubrivivax sp.]
MCCHSASKRRASRVLPSHASACGKSSSRTATGTLNAWRYAAPELLATTDVVHELLQATLHACLAIQQRDTALVDWAARRGRAARGAGRRRASGR